MNDVSGEAVISVRSLRKRYPNGVEAVRDLSLDVRRGEVLGLAGPNGAGKSTLLKLIAGLLRPEAGTVEICGEDVTGSPERAAAHVALMPDPLGVYTDVSSREYLEFFGRVFGLGGGELGSRVSMTADALGLGPWMDAEVETLSAGWQRRLALGRALLADAPVMLLDEPAAGLDVGARADLLEIVRRLASEGRTMIVSSHILPELEDLADRYAVMVDGRWAEVAPGATFFTREELRSGIGGGRRELRVAGGDDVIARATAALDAAGVAYDVEAAGGLNGAVLEILKGEVRQ
jgi:ABC-2 type transport system ATP-binding protein